MSSVRWSCPRCGSYAEGASVYDAATVQDFGRNHRCICTSICTSSSKVRPARRQRCRICRIRVAGSRRVGRVA